jgi:hypothetical protein
MAAAKKAGKKTTTQRNPKPKVEEPQYLCPYCNETKKRSEFYVSTDPLVLTGVTHMCKDCAKKIAMNYDERTGEYGECTKFSVQATLERLDKPYYESLYNSSYVQANDPSNNSRHRTVWDAYMKNITSLNQYRTKRWQDGDLFNTYRDKAEEQLTPMEDQIAENSTPKDQEIYETYLKNKNSVIRLLGYDPFEAEAENDKPLLYSQLVGYLDMGGENEDMMRNSSAITIVRGFLQQAKLDDMIAKSMATIGAEGRAGEIKSLLDSKQKISSTITGLAEQSCLSLKHNKNASKGENTWTGKIKKLKDIDLRDAEVNGFDIGTCRGMQQVLEISDASILKQLRLDESEWSDMVAEQRQLLVDTQRERDVYKEINRILLRENLDLKDTLEENGLLDVSELQNLKELFSPLGEVQTQDEEDDSDE